MPTLSLLMSSPLSHVFLCVWSTLQQHQYDVKWKINYLRTVYHRLLWELAIHIHTFTIPVFTYVNALSFRLLTSERSFLRLVCLSVYPQEPGWASPRSRMSGNLIRLVLPGGQGWCSVYFCVLRIHHGFVCSVRIIELNPYWGITFLMHVWILMGNLKGKGERKRKGKEKEAERRERC